jgi:hypothetical protein
VRWLLLFSLFACSLRADTISVPVTGGGLFNESFFPEFVAQFNLDVPAFNHSLGTLDSLTVDWEAQLFELEIYVAGVPEGSFTTLNYSQVASVTLGGGLSGETLEQIGSTSVFSYPLPCFEVCSVGFPFDFSGTLIITDPSELALFLDSNGPFGVIEPNFVDVMPGPVIGNSSTAFLTDQFTVDNGSYFHPNATATYDYTPVPEARPTFVVLAVCVLLVMWRRNHGWRNSSL